MSLPLSIITVTYNAAEVIDITLKSVAAQQNSDFEHIIVDGLSTDRTLEKVAAHHIANSRVLSEKDRGIYDAMNKGLDMARGEFVLFLNAGDAFHGNDVTSRFINALNGNPQAGVIYGQTILVERNGNFVNNRHLTAPTALTWESFKNGMVVCHQAFFARKCLASHFDISYRFSADYKWCLEILRKSPLNVYLGEDPIIEYLNEGATINNHKVSLRERYDIMCENFGRFPTMLRHIKFLIRHLGRKL